MYLDAVRFLAACLVLVGHLAGQRFTAGLGWQVTPFLDDAVTVFFVLSGFVIAHVSSTREKDWRTYASSRALRVLPVALTALVLTFLLDAAGRAVRPELYDASWGYDPSGWNFVASALFVNQVWTLNAAPGSDLPYWSLGFEVWYYAAFGAALFARRGLLLTALLLLAVGPRVALLYPLWLSGVVCQRLCTRLQARGVVSAWAFPVSLLALAGVEAWGLLHGWPSMPAGTDLWILPGIVRAYVIGVLFCGTVIGLAVAPGWADRMARRTGSGIRWLAGATFSIYLFHLPVAQTFAVFNPWDPGSIRGRLLVLAGTFVMTLLLAELVERRKNATRQAVAHVGAWFR